MALPLHWQGVCNADAVMIIHVFRSPQEDDVIKTIERRISFVTHIPEVNGEGLQILHYEDGQKYEAHHDFFHDKFNSRPENGGQRIATVLMYL